MVLRIDLNADVGEASGDWRTDDDALMSVVTSASIACGGHSGDDESMRRVVDLAVEHGVTIGAHVSYADREGFGRRTVDLDADDLADLVSRQVAALQAVAREAGTDVRYVKPHGALYNRAAVDDLQAGGVVHGIRAVDGSLAVVGLPGGALLRLAEATGLRVVGEAFLDRAYRDDGTLVPRSEPGAVLHDVDEIVARAVQLARDGVLMSQSGARLEVEAETLCLHGDTDGAAGLLPAVRAALEAHGVGIRSFA